MTTSAEVREALVKALELDLVGPGPGHPLEREQLWETEPPSRWYLTGFLVPTEAPEHLRFDPESSELIDAPLPGEDGTGDDDVAPDPVHGRRVYLPSSMGMSVLVPADAREIQAEVFWGEYKKEPFQGTNGEDGKGPEEGKDKGTAEGNAPGEATTVKYVWQRYQRAERVTIPLGTGKLSRHEVPNSKGVKLYVSVRPVNEDIGDLSGTGDGVPPGTRAVSVFVVNERDPGAEDRAEEANLFQVELRLYLKEGFVPRPNLRGSISSDPDERIADLQYRNVYEFAVGHGVATHAIVEAEGDGRRCREVRTTWIPVAAVEKVDPAPVPGVELSMEALAETGSASELQSKLEGFGRAYADWIATAREHALTGRRATVANELLDACEKVRRRIEDGIAMLADPLVFEAFRITNRVMARAARQRTAQIQRVRPAEVSAPRWYPFQLAFLLMNLRGIADPNHKDREVVDLLFFPTGGGKTEAYFGLAAFAIVLRRLRDPSATSAGVTVLMRYTLRLLTLDQLGRAAGLICALELERQKDVEKLGKWPFEIGLWVGLKATPNRMGHKKDGNRESARARTIAFQNDSKHKPSPIPLENCPWCGRKFDAQSFELHPNADHPTDLRIVCANSQCDFTRDMPLPIVAVDECLYRRLPCFIIATVDKLACLPWLGPPGKLFGRVERWNGAAFLGPGEGMNGTPLPRGLPPPDLIIQDELHLISGPLGTMVGLYETAVEGLCRRKGEGEKGEEKSVRPKIVASTATVRRAESQVRALFARTEVAVFPPPGPDRRNSFFARTVPASEKNPRLYVGVAAQGRSLKVALLRVYLALLGAAEKQYRSLGGRSNSNNPADPYMTLVGYFNSLRELGGSRRIVEDEVRSRLQGYARRKRRNQTVGDFANRTIQFEALELTSRVPTNKVAEARQRLALPFSQNEHVDVALATNMISVGLDISRLGLMVVLGQPKTTAEYIQATSRVGRDADRPGLVVTLLNVHRPRDRSHYERFEAYHATFYRSVEATSVTPFAARALDRGLAAVTVALARHGEASLSPPEAAGKLPQHRSRLDWLLKGIRERAERHRDFSQDPAAQKELVKKIEERVKELLDAWKEIARDMADKGGLQYGTELARVPRLLHEPLDPELEEEPPQSLRRKFKAPWSLREVELEIPLNIRTLEGGVVQ